MEGTVTIPLAEYEKLKTIEKALKDKKSVAFLPRGEYFILSESETIKMFLDTIIASAGRLYDVSYEKNCLFIDLTQRDSIKARKWYQWK